jgi:sulfonate transport system permease protein
MIGSINHYILPPPTDIATTRMQLFQSGALLKHLSISLHRMILGFLLTFIVAFPLASILGMKANLNDYFDPQLSLNYSSDRIPKTHVKLAIIFFIH